MSLQVTGSAKDRDGDIIGLCGPGWKHDKWTAVQNILQDARAYWVSVNGLAVYVKVVSRNGLHYLTTAADGYSPNNLDNLPSC